AADRRAQTPIRLRRGSRRLRSPALDVAGGRRARTCRDLPRALLRPGDRASPRHDGRRAMSYVFGALVVALVVIYMARPSFRRTILSAAVFFQDDPVVGSTSRIAWSTPRPTRLFYVQLTVLLLLLLAIPRCRTAVAASDGAHGGVWVLVDRSASMSTIQNGTTRMDRVVTALKNLLAAQSGIRCFRLSAFDMEIAGVADDIGSSAELVDAVSRLKPRA